jgi:hypothetical protein
MVTCKKLGGTDMFVYCILCFNYRSYIFFWEVQPVVHYHFILKHLYWSVFDWSDNLSRDIQLEKIEQAIKNGQSRETGNNWVIINWGLLLLCFFGLRNFETIHHVLCHHNSSHMLNEMFVKLSILREPNMKMCTLVVYPGPLSFSRVMPVWTWKFDTIHRALCHHNSSYKITVFREDPSVQYQNHISWRKVQMVNFYVWRCITAH